MRLNYSTDLIWELKGKRDLNENFEATTDVGLTTRQTKCKKMYNRKNLIFARFKTHFGTVIITNKLLCPLKSSRHN